MSDGAHLGVGAARALGTILGGEPQPTEEEKLTREQFAAKIRSAPKWEGAGGGEGYDATANYAARLTLEFLEAHPEWQDKPGDSNYSWQEGTPTLKVKGVYDAMKDAGIPMSELDLTGFMWGWAFNAARHCLGLGPVANPAILTINT